MFTNEEVIKRLKEDFVPFAGDTNVLQVGHGPLHDWFMSTILPIHPGAEKGVTAQGFYVVGADGTGYKFSMHARPAEKFMELLDQGMAAYKASPPKPVEIPGQAMDNPALVAPAGTLKVRTISRVRPMPEGAPDKNAGFGQDHAWILPEDVAFLHSITEDSAVPDNLAYKLARFHFVDNVRGEPDRWALEEVKYVALRVRPVKANQFEIYGKFSMETATSNKGYEGKFEAQIAIDKKGNPIKFEGLADGMAWGDHRNTSGAPSGKFPVKIAFQNVDDEVSRAVPPQQSYFWYEYFRPTDPKIQEWPVDAPPRGWPRLKE
ncbi:MAG: hypothetical protein KDC26_10435 [Armatimonadetes bacterium]|nr:hypothetical protein [Armatimonadota bacterium]